MVENYHPSTFLSMDSIANSHDELDRDLNGQNLLRPPDINLPLSVEPSPPPQSWFLDDVVDVVGNGHNCIESDKLFEISKVGRRIAKRLDNVWGAWFFFNYYFKPVLKQKSKCNVIKDDANGVSGFDKSDLELDVFLVQHDMENMYMWVFKDRPENALGKMQLRSYMNGHCRQGERPFPFSLEKGFVRSHKMQRKQYRGLSNPQCVHAIELVPSPNLMGIDEDEQKKWMELTGRDLNFCVSSDAKDFSSWRNLPSTDFELERSIPSLKSNIQHTPQRKLTSGSGLNLSTQPSSYVNSNGIDLWPLDDNNREWKDSFSQGIEDESSNPNQEGYLSIDLIDLWSIEDDRRKKDSFSQGGIEDSEGYVPINQMDLWSNDNRKRKDMIKDYYGTNPNPNPNSESPQDVVIHHIEPPWMSEFSGVMKNVYGPVVAAKTIYEDEEGYLIIITLPFANPERVKVHWWNNLTHGVVKISSESTACMPAIKRHGRMFKLTDPSPEHCPPGEFRREIRLPTRIPDDAKLEAYFDKSGTVLEVKVPKHRMGPEEHEVPVCLRPPKEFALS